MSQPDRPTAAARADRHDLYQRAVQDVVSEIDFIAETWAELRDHPARLLREDFCGTAQTACEWVRRDPAHRAIGLDLDPEVLDWGRRHNVGALPGPAARRMELVTGDVRLPPAARPDIVLAMNFSYYLFLTREDLEAYFAAVRDSLADDGVFFLDAYGGYDAYRDIEEERDCEGFTYTWEQVDYNPIDGTMRCLIHFDFPDGSRMEAAFAYDWRLWSLPEIREALEAAGFRAVTVYWEGTDPETGEGNGEYEPALVGDADPGWICYLVAEP